MCEYIGLCCGWMVMYVGKYVRTYVRTGVEGSFADVEYSFVDLCICKFVRL